MRWMDILLIEPDARHAEILSDAVKKTCSTCALHLVQNPEDAKKFVHDGRKRRPNPSLIILDLLDLDKTPATAFLRWLKRHPRTKHLPVIVLGTEGDVVAITKAYQLGASSYLVKPKNERELSEMVATAAHYWTKFNQSPE